MTLSHQSKKIRTDIYNLGLITTTLFISTACGVKGPPLPPIPVTPAQSELPRNAGPNPEVEPTPKPSPQEGAGSVM